MADGNQLKTSDQIDVPDDDPFAELTRIMGFDPRQSVKQAEEQKAADKAAAASEDRERASEAQTSVEPEDDDFSIDLEKELMGEFSGDDEADFRAHDAAAETHVEHAVEEPVEPEAAVPAQPEAAVAAPEPVVNHASVASEAATDDGDADFDFDFDDAIAASVNEDAEPVAAAHADDVSLEGWDESELLDALEAEPEAVEPGAVESEPAEAAPEPTFDAAPQPSGQSQDDADIIAELHAAMSRVEFDMAGEQGDPHHDAEPTADAGQDASAPKAEDGHEHGDLDDLHLDMGDLRLEADEPVHEADQPVLEADEAVYEADQPAHEAGQESVDAFELDPSDLDFEEPAFHAQETEEPETEPAEAHFDVPDLHLDAADLDLEEDHEPVEADHPVETEPHQAYADGGYDDVDDDAQATETDAVELSFDEVDFGSDEPVADDESYRAQEPEEEAPSFASYVEEEPAHAEPPARAASPMDIAAAEYRERGNAPTDLASAFSLEDELKALLGNYTEGSAKAEQPAAPMAAPVAEAEEASRYAADDDLAWELDDLVEAAAAAEAEPGFEVEPEQVLAEAQRNAPDYYDDAPSAPVSEDEAVEDPTPYREAVPAAAAASMFSRAPAFSARYQQQQSDESAEYRRDAWSSTRQAAPRDPMREDPLDVIAELTAKYSQPLPTNPSDLAGVNARYSDAPDVETIEVADRAVALADDLDLPEVDYEEELPPVSAYDDLETDFAGLLHDMNDADPAPAAASSAAANDYQQERAYRTNGVAAAGLVSNASTIPGAYRGDANDFSVDADYLPGSRPAAPAQFGDDDFDYDPDLDDSLSVAAMGEARRERPPQRRGLLVAAIVGGVALVGAIGAFALSFGGDGDSDVVAIVKADDGPSKVKPENPGGTTVPNQDSKVYETVAGEGSITDPQQQKLVTTAEEPVDMAPADIEDDPVVAAKSEDRIEQILQETENKSDAEIAAIAPRKVRTMVVRPDGTLVPREDTAADVQTDSVNSAQEAVTAEAVPQASGTQPDATDQETVATIDETPVMDGEAPVEEAASADAPEGTAADASQTPASTPASAPIAPQRPSEQPIDVVGEVKPDQVASAATSAGGGEWSMQIASQPSEAAAQSSYRNLVSRYGSVLNGREANIVKAEIAGKGTYWRVRVPAPSRNEAISLCETYKAAGGNCFVSR